MFQQLGRIIARHPYVILFAWLAVGVSLYLLAPTWEERAQDDDLRFLPADCMSMEGYRLLSEAFPREVSGSKVIFAFERHDGPLTASDLALVDQAAGELETARCQQLPLRCPPDQGGEGGVHWGTVTSYRDPLIGKRLLSADRQCTLVFVSLETPFLALKTGDAVRALETLLQPLVAAHRQREGAAAEGLRVVTTGTSGMGRDLNQAAFESIEHTTLATIMLVVAILLLIYRAPLLALIPLATIGSSVWISLRVLSLLSLCPEIQLVNITRVFVVVMLYGAGTDYCLFLISRYREELGRGLQTERAITASLRRVGWALTASAGTVIVGLSMMGFAEFAKLRCSGPAIALSLAIALLASLTLAPALLGLFGPAAFWPRRLSAGTRMPQRISVSALWTWVSKTVALRPGRIWLTSVIVLLPFAVIGLATQSTYHIAAELPLSSPGRAGLDMLRQHFNPGELGPLTVLVQADRDWRTPAGQGLLARLTEELSGIDNVGEVRSCIQPLGQSASPSGTAPKLAVAFVERLAAERYLADISTGPVARFEVVFQTEPFAAESNRTLAAIREHLERFVAAAGVPGLRFATFGITTVSHDVSSLQASDRVLVNSLVLLGILLILLAVVRRPLVACYLLMSVLFTYFVAIGATELISLGWLDPELGAIDWKVPFFLFTILVATGEDYNIFLMTRVQEEAQQRGLREAVPHALRCTGATISACGLIMAGTFATLMLGQLPTLVQLGMALTIGVLLDTFIVRPVLVPAFLLMICRPSRPVGGRVDAPAIVQGPHQLIQEPLAPVSDADEPDLSHLFRS